MTCPHSSRRISLSIELWLSGNKLSMDIFNISTHAPIQSLIVREGQPPQSMGSHHDLRPTFQGAINSGNEKIIKKLSEDIRRGGKVPDDCFQLLADSTLCSSLFAECLKMILSSLMQVAGDRAPRKLYFRFLLQDPIGSDNRCISDMIRFLHTIRYPLPTKLYTYLIHGWLTRSKPKDFADSIDVLLKLGMEIEDEAWNKIFEDVEQLQHQPRKRLAIVKWLLLRGARWSSKVWGVYLGSNSTVADYGLHFVWCATKDPLYSVGATWEHLIPNYFRPHPHRHLQIEAFGKLTDSKCPQKQFNFLLLLNDHLSIQAAYKYAKVIPKISHLQRFSENDPRRDEPLSAADERVVLEVLKALIKPRSARAKRILEMIFTRLRRDDEKV